MIQALIPIGLEAVSDVLQHEVQELAGGRYARKSSDQSHRRWGKQKGWVYLGTRSCRLRCLVFETQQRVSRYPWTRGCCSKCSRGSPVGTTRLVRRPCLKPSVFPLLRFLEGSSRPDPRSSSSFRNALDDYDFVALFIDGKSFADEQMVIALGVTMDGQKIPLGFVESAAN